MTTDRPIKCVSGDFKASPFYLVQSNGSDRRFVASFQDKHKIKSFLNDFIYLSAGDMQVRIRDCVEQESPVDFDGLATKYKIVAALDKYEDVIFHDGYHDLMLRRPETGDYIAFDEHGLVYIYTFEDYSGMLEELGLAYRGDERLIYQFDHWHYRPANGREDLNNLISELGLEG